MPLVLRITHSAAFVAILLLSACGRAEQAPLRVGLVLWPPYSLFTLAQELGYLGPEIELVDLPSPADAVRAYRNRIIDLLPITLENALVALEEDSTQRIVLVIDISVGGDAIVARPELTSMADLTGRRVGFEAGPLGTFVLLRSFEMAGLSTEEVILIPVDVADHVDAYVSGRLDAVVTYEPHRTRILAQGARQLFSTAEIPGEVVDVLLVRAETATARAAAIQRLVDGWFQAVEYSGANPEDSLDRIAGREGLTRDELRAAFDGIRLPDRAENLQMLSGQDAGVNAAWRRHADFLLDQEILPRPVDPARLLLDRFVRTGPR